MPIQTTLTQAVTFSLALAITSAMSVAVQAQTLPPLVPPDQPVRPAAPAPAESASAASAAPGPRPSESAAALRHLDRPTVAIREFRTSVAEISARGATDMFITALIKTRKFRVLERARLAESAGAEKALNQAGLTEGQASAVQLKAAQYVFEATISEASSEDKRSTVGIGFFGASAGRSRATGSLAIDVRIIDVESGVVVDAVDVRKELQSVEKKVAGVSNAIANAATGGRLGALLAAGGAVDEYVQARRDSLDRAVREAIEEAVGVLAQRLEVK
jgi:curli biogenesis system outer membrane secretion channel CsgG